MMLDFVARRGARHQEAVAENLRQGAAQHGVSVRIVDQEDDVSSAFVGCWGWRRGRQLAQRSSHVLIAECGYIGNRLFWTSLGWDGLNGRGRFPQVPDGGVRYRANFSELMRPVKTEPGAYVLLLGQVRGDASLIGVNTDMFYREAACTLQARFGLPVRFRPHPREVEYGRHTGPYAFGMETLDGSLEEALAGAHCAVAYNSNALTDAVLAGVPVLAMDEGAMVWPIAGRGLHAEPGLKGRCTLMHRLAWCQWQPDEIASGLAWQAISQVMKGQQQWAA